MLSPRRDERGVWVAPLPPVAIDREVVPVVGETSQRTSNVCHPAVQQSLQLFEDDMSLLPVTNYPDRSFDGRDLTAHQLAEGKGVQRRDAHLFADVAKTLFEAPPHLGGCGPGEGQGNDGAGRYVLGLDEELDPAHKDEGFPRAGPSQDNGVPSSPPSNRSLLLSQPLTPGHGQIVGASVP